MYFLVLSIKFRFFQKKNLAAKSVQCQENGHALKKKTQTNNPKMKQEPIHKTAPLEKKKTQKNL